MDDVAARLAAFLAKDEDQRLKCKVCDNASPEVTDAIETAHANGATVASLMRFLNAEGCAASYAVVSRHLRGHDGR